eukprot:12662410-Alexandrium_andersonii.AAC.1
MCIRDRLTLLEGRWGVPCWRGGDSSLLQVLQRTANSHATCAPGQQGIRGLVVGDEALLLRNHGQNNLAMAGSQCVWTPEPSASQANA